VDRLPRSLQSFANTTGCAREPATLRIDAGCGDGDVADARDPGLH
jgi:hypothetical protein